MTMKYETRVFSSHAGDSNFTDQINTYLEGKHNAEISYHNVQSSSTTYVIATVKVELE